jgi:hypothetical protein
MNTCSAGRSETPSLKGADERNAHGTETITSSWDGRTKGCGKPLWCRSPGGEEWGSCLRSTMRDGRGRTPYYMHARDTGDTPGKRRVRGTIESSDPAVGNSCEVQEENPTSMEDREEVVLRIPRNPAMQRPRAIARAPSYKCPRDEQVEQAEVSGTGAKVRGAINLNEKLGSWPLRGN